VGDRRNVMLGEHDGVPFISKRSGPFLYGGDGVDRNSPQNIRQVKVDILNLGDPGHKDYYDRIWEAVGYGLVRVSEEERHWNEDTKSFTVFIRWFSVALMDPSELRTAKLGIAKKLQKAFDKESEDAHTGLCKEPGTRSSCGDPSGDTHGSPEPEATGEGAAAAVPGEGGDDSSTGRTVHQGETVS